MGIGGGDDPPAIPAKKGVNFSTNRWGGVQGTLQDDGQAMVPGTSGADIDSNRYRQMGADAQSRGGIALNYGNANTSFNQSRDALGQASQSAYQGDQMRNQQADATGLMQSAAYGNQPSQAELLGKAQTNASLRAQMAGAAGARGGVLNQAMAQRNVANNAASFQAQNNQQMAALRANEMANARSAYGQQLSGVRAQDYQGAQTQQGIAGAYNQMAGQQAQMSQAQGALDMQQRQLNDQAQGRYEQMGWETKNADLQGQLQARGQDIGERQGQAQIDQQNQDRTLKYMGAATSGIGGVIGGLLSDERTKDKSDSSRVGSAIGQGMTNAGAALAGNSAPQASQKEGWLDKWKRQSDEKDRQDRMAKSTAVSTTQAPSLTIQPGQDIQRDDPYASPTPGGGIIRENPYSGLYDPRTGTTVPGSEDYEISDANAKIEARREGFDDAMKYAAAGQAGSTVNQADYVPEYMKGAPPTRPRPEMQPKESAPATRAPVSGGAKTLVVTKPEATPTADPSHGPDAGDQQYGHYNARNGRRWDTVSQDVARDKAPPREPVQEVGGSATARGFPAPVPSGQPKLKYGPTGEPLTGPLAEIRKDANRKQAGVAYAYKPEFAEQSGQAPGEMNYGFMAQDLQKNPITATAVKQGDDGLLRYDPAKLQKVQSDSIASLQQQIDEMKGGGRYG